MRRIFFATTEHYAISSLKYIAFLWFPYIVSGGFHDLNPPPPFFPTTSKSQCYYQLRNPQIDELKFYNSAIKQNTNLFLVVKMVDSNGIPLNNKKCGGS